MHQVMSFSRYLNAIHCFYTDRQVDFDMLEAFSPEEIECIAPMEHERWVRKDLSVCKGQFAGIKNSPARIRRTGRDWFL